MVPGEYLLQTEPIQANLNRDTLEIVVANVGDRPIQVGSHFHFFELNRQLDFDREKTLGLRLDVPAGTAVRFAPGESHTVRLRPFGGRQIIRGNGLVDGAVSDPDVRARALQRARDRGFIREATE